MQAISNIDITNKLKTYADGNYTIRIFYWKDGWNMKLIIAEKPGVSREISQVVGANIRRDGYLEVIFSEYCLAR